MDSDLISRAEMLNRLNDMFKAADVLTVKAYSNAFRLAIVAAETAPAVDAEPVRHGRWEHGMQCSFCKQIDTAKPNYCPNCGAKMDKEDER